MPSSGNLDFFITDVNGKIVAEKSFLCLNQGNNTIDISDKVKLASGVYVFNFSLTESLIR